MTGLRSVAFAQQSNATLSPMDQANVSVVNCSYPFVPPGCTTLYSDLPSIGSPYRVWQAFWIAFGVSAFLLAGIRLFFVLRHGNAIQKLIFPLLCLCSVTFIIRAVDPYAYGGVVSLTVFSLMEALNNCCLYLIAYCITIIWGGLVSSLTERKWPFSKYVIGVGILLILLTCSMLVAAAAYISRHVQEDTHKFVAVLFLILAITGVCGFSYFVYVGNALRRLLDISVQKTDVVREGARLSDLEKVEVEESHAVGQHRCCGIIFSGFLGKMLRRWSRTSMVYRMLWAFSTIFLTITLLQVYVAVSAFRGASQSRWYSYSICVLEKVDANSCQAEFEDVTFPFAEYLMILLFTWAFWKLPNASQESRGYLANPAFLTPSTFPKTMSFSPFAGDRSSVSRTPSFYTGYWDGGNLTVSSSEATRVLNTPNGREPGVVMEPRANDRGSVKAVTGYAQNVELDEAFSEFDAIQFTESARNINKAGKGVVRARI